MDTYLESTGEGLYKLQGLNSRIKNDKSGNIHISGSNTVKIGGKVLDFSELPDRYVRPSGVSWQWIANNTEVFGVLPISIGDRKVYIPFIGNKID